MENYFIIHGSFGNPFGNWFSWLQDFISSDRNLAEIIEENYKFIYSDYKYNYARN